VWDESHVNDANDEGGDRDDDSGDDPPQDVTAFTGLETTGTLFDSGAFFDGGG
jgi:hypothetical protein